MKDSAKSREELQRELNDLRQLHMFTLEEKERELVHLAHLLEVGNATLDLDLVMDKVMAALGDVINFNRLAIYLYDAKRSVLEPKYCYGHDVDHDLRARLSKLPVSIDWDDVLLVRAFLDVEAIYLSPVNSGVIAAQSNYDQQLYEWGAFSGLALVPLQVQEKVIGVVLLSDSRAPFDLRRLDRARVEQYIGQVAVTINNAYLVKKTRYALDRAKKREQELAHLNAVLQAANSSLNIDKVFGTVVEGLQQIFTFDAAGIQLVDDAGEMLAIYKVYGESVLSGYLADWASIPVTTNSAESVSSHVFHSGEPAYFHGIHKDMPFTKVDRAFYDVVPFDAYLAFPLIVRGRVVGVINFFSAIRRPMLDEDALSVIQRYVHAVSSAIYNASRYDKLKSQQAEFRSISTKKD